MLVVAEAMAGELILGICACDFPAAAGFIETFESYAVALRNQQTSSSWRSCVVIKQTRCGVSVTLWCDRIDLACELVPITIQQRFIMLI